MKNDPKNLRRLASEVNALKRAMEMTINLKTEDFGKWNGFANYAKTYVNLVKKFHRLTGRSDLTTYDTEKLPSWSNLVWHQAKNLFEQVYTDTLILSANTAEYETEGMMSRSEVHDLIATNWRKALFDKPSNELQVQNAMETLLIGRGYQKGFDYERESGRVKFSGKEFIPDFVFPSYSLSIEVKLIKESSKISKCIEEMSADIPAYLSAYESILFCIYDLGAIQNVDEFTGSFLKQAGVSVCVVKH